MSYITLFNKRKLKKKKHQVVRDVGSYRARRRRPNCRPSASEQPRDGSTTTVVVVVAAVVAVAAVGGRDVGVMNRSKILVAVASGKTYPAAAVVVVVVGVRLAVAAGTKRQVRTTNADQRSSPLSLC